MHTFEKSELVITSFSCNDHSIELDPSDYFISFKSNFRELRTHAIALRSSPFDIGTVRGRVSKKRG